MPKSSGVNGSSEEKKGISWWSRAKKQIKYFIKTYSDSNFYIINIIQTRFLEEVYNKFQTKLKNMREHSLMWMNHISE